MGAARTMEARRALAQLALIITSAAMNIPTQEVAPGVDMPVISVGTWTEGTSSNATNIVHNWLELVGRGIDTALVYFDQDTVAAAMAASGVPREDIFLTTKIPGCFDGKGLIERDLKQLNTSYIDLVLIHR